MGSFEPAYEIVGIPVVKLSKITVLPLAPHNEDSAVSRARLEAAKAKLVKLRAK